MGDFTRRYIEIYRRTSNIIAQIWQHQYKNDNIVAGEILLQQQKYNSGTQIFNIKIRSTE